MALLSHLPIISKNIPLICRKESAVLSTLFSSWWFFIFKAQCQSDTLNAPADKLLLSQLIKLGGHSAISGRCAPLNLSNE